MAKKISAKRRRPYRHGQTKRARLRKHSQAPRALVEEKTVLQSRLGELPEWDEDNALLANYHGMGILPNPNTRAEDRSKCPLKKKKTREQDGEPTYSDDDELRAAGGLQRKTGKAAPRRLSDRQRKFIAKLIEKHGDDFEAMKWDRQLNKFQHSPGKLKMYIESFNFWKPEQGLSYPRSMKKFAKLRF